MSLSPGTRLGPYEVTAKIGPGGMGEAYRARDTKLDRHAMKVLVRYCHRRSEGDLGSGYLPQARISDLAMVLLPIRVVAMP